MKDESTNSQGSDNGWEFDIGDHRVNVRLRKEARVALLKLALGSSEWAIWVGLGLADRLVDSFVSAGNRVCDGLRSKLEKVSKEPEGPEGPGDEGAPVDPFHF